MISYLYKRVRPQIMFIQRFLKFQKVKFSYSIFTMDSNQALLTKADLYSKLKSLDINVEVHNHTAVFNMKEMEEQVKFKHNTAFVKNLLFVDKKNNLYFILADSKTKVGKLFWKNIGQSSGNMRMSKPEHLEQYLQTKQGHLNPFSLANDKEDKVKKIIIDENLKKYTHLGVHPLENDATVEILLEDLNEKILKPTGKEIVLLNLVDEEQEKPKVAEESKQQEQQEQEDSVQQLAITIKKAENFSKWYQQVITKSEMIEYYDVSGCYILRPWSYSIWDSIQKYFDTLIQSEGVENSYFPMFVSERALNKEKDHVEGFAPEVAWVTEYGTSKLKEKVAIRPTSETIMYPAFSKWIKGHRDLPLKLNQWTNIVRWEFKYPTPFIRTREFLWQEGHTAHATEQQATEFTFKILDFYASVYTDLLAIPVVKGIKTESEKFAGGYFTTSVETIIPQNGRGVQAATSHQLGQNFSKMFDIQFEDEKRVKQYVWQTSWGLTTRSLGILVMFHGDDKGLVLPPKVAKYQVVIIPIPFKDQTDLSVEAKQLKDKLVAFGVRVHVDDRDNYNPGWKYNHWEQKGVPLRFELGPKDIEKNEVRVVQRFDGKKYQLSQANIGEQTLELLAIIHKEMLAKAQQQFNSRLKKANNWQEFMHELNQQNTIETLWCQQEQCEKNIKLKSGVESKEQDQVEDGQVQLTGAAKTLNMPLAQPIIQENDKCFFCGEKAVKSVIWGRSY